LPTAEYAAKLAGTDLGNALEPHMRVDPDGMSPQEAAEFMRDQQQRFEEVRQQAESQMATNTELARSAKAVENQMFEQIKATGRYSDKEARAAAVLYRNVAVAQGTREGLTPEQFVQKYPYTVQAAPDADTYVGSPLHQAAPADYLQPDALAGMSREEALATLASHDPSKFVAAPDGTADFGHVPEEVASKKGLPSGPIRMRVGSAAERWGLAHLLADHGEQFERNGFASAQEFAEHISRNLDAIYERPRDPNGLDLVTRKGRTGRMVVSLEYNHEGHFYDIKTAHPTREKQFANKIPLWDGTGTSPSNAEAHPLLPGAKAATNILHQPAYHGSPYRFDKFSLEHIGRGEGNQSYGWGLYFAGDRGVSEGYRNLREKQITYDGRVLEDYEPEKYAAEALLENNGNKTDAIRNIHKFALERNFDIVRRAIQKMDYSKVKRGGQLYRVDIPEDNKLLDWDKPLSEQPEAVREALKQALSDPRIADRVAQFKALFKHRI
ncbi:MAG: hypothetical protein FWD64_12030, partial [Acidobacteriaceae bacterium]|nr:hypothetical protein [Acidobacteriaceae bacterium]